MDPLLQLARRVVVFNVIPPATVCVLTGVWALDQAALAFRLIQAHRRSLGS